MRSGSTLLGRLLGALPGAFNAGEAHTLWFEITKDGRCSCRARLGECPVWRQVIDIVGPQLTARGWSVEEAHLWRERTLALRRLRLIPDRQLSRNGASRQRAQYVELMRLLYLAVADVTGTRTLVDTSKVPAGALLLEGMSPIEGRIVHLVRDPRATVHSWATTKRKELGDEHSGWVHELAARNWGAATASWMAYNAVLSFVVANRSLPYRQVRYEDFCADPTGVMADLAAWCGLDPGALPIDANGVAHLEDGHSASGNADRFSAGAIPISAREEWRAAMGPSKAAAISLMTTPLRSRYSYPPSPIRAGAG